MIVKLLTEHHLEFLSLKGGCRGLSQSTHVKIPHCRPLCRNLGSRVHFLVKVIIIDFHLEKYMQCKEKDVYNFFLQY